MVRNKRMLVVVTLAILTVIAVLSVVFPTNSKAINSDPLPNHEIRKEGWKYTAARDPDGIVRIETAFEGSTIDDLVRFASINRRLAQQLIAAGETEATVTITFRSPTPIDAFRAWAARSPLVIESWELWFVGINGKGGGTVGGRPEGSEVLLEYRLKQMLDGPRSSSSDFAIRGVYSVVARIRLADYLTLAIDRNVFAVDVTRSAALLDLSGVVRDIDRGRVVASTRPIFDRMQRLGLGHFAGQNEPTGPVGMATPASPQPPR